MYRIDTQTIEQFLLKYFKKYQYIPSTQEWNRLDNKPCRASTIGRRYGGYTTFCQKVIGQKRKRKRNLVSVICPICAKSFLRIPAEVSRNNHNFCSRSCAATFRNKNKTYGYKRSKLEDIIINYIKKDFPSLKIVANDSTIVGLELDIFLPELRLAIELNGPFHYEPIYGSDKLERMQRNDKQKQIACNEKGIELLVINTSHIRYLKQEKIDLVYNDIKSIINQVIGRKISKD